MENIEDDIQHLIEIARKDTELQELKRDLASIPARVKAIEKEIRRMDEDLEETKKTLDKLEQEKRRIESLIKSQKSELEHKRSEQMKVKTNKELQAILAEIQYISSQIDKEEERILEILEEMETRGKEMKKITDRISSERDSLVRERDRLLSKQRGAEEAMRICEDEKNRVLPKLSQPIRRLYDRILRAKGDSGVANIVGDICQGCHSRVPPQKAHEVRRNNAVMTCEVCGRILVYFEHQTGNSKR